MRVAVRGAELFYSTRGDGPVCMVLSAIGTKPYERMLAPALADRFRLVHVDLRGGGQSTGDPTDLTFDQLADDLEAVRQDAGVERVAVLGHSILGALVIEYARRCPGAVSHVIVAGTPPVGDLRAVQAAAVRFFEVDASDDRKNVLRENLSRLDPSATPGQAMYAHTPMRFFDPRFDAPSLFVGSEFRPALLGHILGTLTPKWDVAADADGMRTPLLVAHGRHDYVVPHALWKPVVPRLSAATFEMFAKSGHHPFVEEPARFAAVVTDWMGARA